jgi:hypothetical protein
MHYIYKPEPTQYRQLIHIILFSATLFKENTHNEYSWGNLKGRDRFTKPMHKWEDNIKMALKEKRYKLHSAG